MSIRKLANVLIEMIKDVIFNWRPAVVVVVVVSVVVVVVAVVTVSIGHGRVTC